MNLIKGGMKIIKLPMKTKLVFLEALLLLVLSKILIRLLSFKRLSRVLGDSQKESNYSNEGIDLYQIKKIAIAIKAISKYTPWKSNCLVQACAGKMMLNIRRVQSTVYLGVGKDGSGNLIAHAWLRCGSYYITGGDGSVKFTVTGKFS